MNNKDILRKLRVNGVKEQDLERVIALLSCSSIREAELANGRIGGGAGYDQVIALDFREFLPKEEFVQEALREFRGEPLSEIEIREYLADRTGSYGFIIRLDESRGISFEERKRLEEKMQFFKHNLLRKYFGFG